VSVDKLVLGRGLAQRPVAAAALALFQHRQRTAHADEPGGQIGQHGGAIGHPRRHDQHVVGDDTHAGARQRGNGAMHRRDKAMAGGSGLRRPPQHVIPKRLLQVAPRQHP